MNTLETLSATEKRLAQAIETISSLRADLEEKNSEIKKLLEVCQGVVDLSKQGGVAPFVALLEKAETELSKNRKT